MASRLDLHGELLKILPNVYYQPPESFKISYPCIIYNRSHIKHEFADNKIYNSGTSYTLTLIDKDPDSVYIDKILGAFSMISFDRHFTADHLNHDTFTLFY